MRARVLAALLAAAAVAGLAGAGRGPARAAEPALLPFGDAAPLAGALPPDPVAATGTPAHEGLLVTNPAGAVRALGDAVARGGIDDRPLAAPVVAIERTPSGGGYWLVARDGGVFTFGNAGFFGSTGGMRLNEPVVAAAATATGRGYWLVARDGGVFTFGDAAFHGSAAGAIAPGHAAVAFEPSRRGYWIVSGPGAARVAVAGDVHGERQIGDQARAGQHPLGGVAPVLAAADVAAVNLETPAGRPGTPQPKQYVFLAPPELLGALRAGGVDVVSLANNHALDHGPATLLETIDHARAAGLAVVGAGADAAAAYAPAFVDAGRRRVAFVGLSMVVPPGWAAGDGRPGVASAYDQRRSLDAVRGAAARADDVVVLVHWGVELATCPAPGLVRFADALHAAGATVVAGHHPHVLQGVDARHDRVTAYSLGNFVWYHNEPPTDTTGILDVSLGDGRVETRFHPATIGGDGRPSLLAGAGADAVRRSVMGGPCRRSTV